MKGVEKDDDGVDDSFSLVEASAAAMAAASSSEIGGGVGSAIVESIGWLVDWLIVDDCVGLETAGSVEVFLLLVCAMKQQARERNEGHPS